MKRFVASLVVLTMLISFAIITGVLPDASGEGVSFHRVLPVEQDWMSSDGTPALTVATNEYTIVFVDGNLVAIPVDEKGQRTIISCAGRTPRSAYAYGNYVYVKYENNPMLSIYSLPDLEYCQSAIPASHVTGRGSKLYISSYNVSTLLMDVSEFDLSENITLELKSDLPLTEFYTKTGTFSPELEPSSVRSIAMSDSTLYYVNDRGEVCSLSLDGANHNVLMDDKQYESVATANGVVVAVGMTKVGENSDYYARAVDTVSGRNVILPLLGDAEKSVRAPLSVTTSGARLYFCDGESHSTNCFEVVRTGDVATVEYVRSIAGKGSGSGRLNSPSGIYCGDKVYVADTENNRILIKDSDNTYIETGFDAPFALTEWKGSIVVADAEGVKKINSGTAPTLIMPSATVNSIAATKDYLFVSQSVDGTDSVSRITDNGTDYTVEDFWSEDDAPVLMLAAHKDGSTLIVFTDTHVHAVFGNGTPLFSTSLSSLGLAHNGTTKVVYSARATSYGDVHLLYSSGSSVSLIHLTRTLTGFEHDDDTDLALPEAFTGFDFASDGSLLFTEKSSHSLFEMRGYAISTTATNYPHANSYLSKKPLPESAHVFRATTDTFFCTSPFNYETVVPVQKGEVLLALSNESVRPTAGGQAYFYVYYNGTAGYVVASDLEVLPAGTAPSSQYKYVNKNHTDVLYKYPIDDNRFKLLTIDRHSELVPTGTVSGYDGDAWYSVLYGGLTYYVKRVHVDIETPPAPTVYYYAKIKAQAIGTTVNVYTLADNNSSVKGTLADGVEVKLIAEFNPADTYTYVVCGDIEGYVLTYNVITGGLTEAQTTGLVLICLAGATSLAVLGISRKLKAQKED